MRPPRTALAGCTIIAKNYVAQARVLAHSFFAHEPDGRFYVLVVDELPEGVDIGPGVQVLGPADLAMPDFEDMRFRYDVTELCTAVKPTFLSILLGRLQEQRVAFFDPDILIFRPLNEVHAALDEATIVLIPHLLEPIPLDGKKPAEQDILIAGAYNLGFIALRESDEVRRFLAWWHERLVQACLVDPARGLFVDQKWVDLVPSLFASTAVLRDPTYDVAYWNLHSRALERHGPHFCVQGMPLAFFHFSGFNPAHRRALSKHQTRIDVVDGTPLADLLDMYVDLLERSNARVSKDWPYGFGFFDNGIPVAPLLRRLYADLPESSRKAFGDPFRTTGIQSFLNWATRPAPDSGLSPFADSVYRARPDAAAAFTDAYGIQREAFLRWARADGARQMGYDPRLLVPARPNGEAHDAPLAGSLSGVNVCGYLRNETGIGAIARGYVAALQSAGVPTALADIAPLSPNRSEDPTFVEFDTDHPHDVNLICVNADQHFNVVAHMGEEFFRDRYNIGVWFWELPRFPSEWHDRFNHYDEIWAASSFIAGALGPISPVPVVRMPPVLTLWSRGSRRIGRERLRASADEFVFLFVFDFRSMFERKNPLALIEAFRLAFAPTESVRLVVKCVNEDFAPDDYQRMHEACDGAPITIQAGYISLGEMRDLIAACDAYVSLHRSEGLGLTMAEAMALGKPVIATAWSGNTDFMTVSNSFPISYRLVELTEDVGPYRAGEVWAEPSVEDAARLMRLVHDDRDQAFTRGMAAKHDVQSQFSVESVASKVQERLGVVAHRLGERTGHRSANGVALAQTDRAGGLKRSGRAPAVPPMDLGSSIYGPLGLMAKRGMHFLLSYHTLYQAQLNVSFAEFMRDLASGVDRQEDVVSGLQEQFARLQFDTRRGLAGSRNLQQHMAHLHEFVRSLDDAHVELANQFETLAKQYEQLRTLAEPRAAPPPEVPPAEPVEPAPEPGAAPPADPLVTHARLAELEARLADLAMRFSARPFMADDPYGMANLDSPMGYDLDGSRPPAAAKPPFAELFRGSAPFVADRQRVYVPFFEGKTAIVDLGCGRGEFLRLLADAGLAAVGVDADPKVITTCVADGLTAVVCDALEYMRSQPSNSLDGIFSAQFIEHISPPELADLLALARDRLRPGGTFIAETVNPESHTALKTFHVDLSHQVPIYPQVLLHMCQLAGFTRARIFYPVGGGFTQSQYETAGEYAVIATV